MRSRVARNKGENRVTEYPLMSAANGGKTDRCMVCPQKLMGNARYIYNRGLCGCVGRGESDESEWRMWKIDEE